MREIDFPKELLSASKDARHQYFRNYIVAHPKLIAAHDRLVYALDQQRDPLIIIVYGLTGVGKSTLRRIVVKRFIDRYLPEMKSNASFIPIVSINAVSPKIREFDWDDFWARSLLSMNEPLVDRKIVLHSVEKELSEYTGYAKYQRMKSSALRRSLESALLHRGVKAFLVDEAQAIGKIATGRKVLAQLEIIKDLTEAILIDFALIGTYDLANFMNQNGQTARRSLYIHFERYRSDRQEDIFAFQGVLKSIERNVPINEIVDLVSIWKYLIVGSCGGVGTLKTWLLDALALALHEDSDIITLDHLKRTALTEKQIRTILLEATANEGEIMTSQTSETSLYSFENLKGLIKWPTEKKQKEIQHILDTKPTKRTYNKRPGLRKPKRDPVRSTAIAS